MRLPYFHCYAGDLLSSDAVIAMSLEQFGAYWLLLAHAWKRGESGRDPVLRDDNPYLAKLLGISVAEWLQIRSVLVDGSDPVFEVVDGHLRNKRLLEEHAKAVRQYEGAVKAANKRWGKETAEVIPITKQRGAKGER